MEYDEFPPPPDAAPHVRCIWTLRAPDPSAAGGATPSGNDDAGEPALPDGSPELIINVGPPFDYLAPDGTRTRQPHAFLVGQITRPFVVQPTGSIDLMAVRFEAHGASLICDDLAAITDGWTPIASLPVCGVIELARMLRETGDVQVQVELVGRWLQHLVKSRPPADPRVVAAVRFIRDGHGTANLEALCRALSVSPRTLQRLFARQVGIAPKLLSRIVRFQRVLRAWRSDPRTFARVAADSGYFDQSHLVRDFRDFAGAPPAGLLAALPDFTAQFLM